MIIICNENDHSDTIYESNTDDKCSDNGTSNNNNDNNNNLVAIIITTETELHSNIKFE